MHKVSPEGWKLSVAWEGKQPAYCSPLEFRCDSCNLVHYPPWKTCSTSLLHQTRSSPLSLLSPADDVNLTKFVCQNISFSFLRYSSLRRSLFFLYRTWPTSIFNSTTYLIGGNEKRGTRGLHCKEERCFGPSDVKSSWTVVMNMFTVMLIYKAGVGKG